jgi:pre-mRNA cleavage complex 2 protein Pcf11
MDAIKIGSRVYHGTCYVELKKDGAKTPVRTPTPETVLGKRKAGVSDDFFVSVGLCTNLLGSDE